MDGKRKQSHAADLRSLERVVVAVVIIIIIAVVVVVVIMVIIGAKSTKN